MTGPGIDEEEGYWPGPTYPEPSVSVISAKCYDVTLVVVVRSVIASTASAAGVKAEEFVRSSCYLHGDDVQADYVKEVPAEGDQ